MKIAMAHVDLPNETKGGVASQAHLLANALVSRGHDVTMFTFSPKFDACRYHVHRYARPRGLNRLSSFLLAARLAGTDFSSFDVIHTHGDNYLLHGRHPQIRTFHGAALDEAHSARTVRRRLYQRLIVRLEVVGGRAADVCVGVSETTRTRIPAVSLVIPCGVDLTRFRPGPKSETPALLFVGTVGGRKRGAFLADVFQREVRPLFPSAELWMVADRPVEGAGVVNYGRVSEEALIELFQRAWAFCLPSTYEGFGVPYIEALASGTVAVGSPNPGAREVLAEGKYGIIAEDDALGDGLRRVLGNAEERRSYETAGLLRVPEYAWDRIAERYEQVYRQAQGRNATATFAPAEGQPT